MSKTSTESVNTTATAPLSAVKDTATIFNPAAPTIVQAQSQADVSQTDAKQPYHHKANHNQNRSVAQSSDVTTANATATMPVSAAPKIGFVSLGCPKALVDSERIITELSRDGY
ncbi:MAG: 30S ribosomal protein S12 methylthiotransferase RimO, partial [Psychrobacter sp.]